MRILRIRRYRANCVLIRSNQIATNYFGILPNTRSEKLKVLEVKIRRLWMQEQALKVLEANKELKDGLEVAAIPERLLAVVEEVGWCKGQRGFNSLENHGAARLTGTSKP